MEINLEKIELVKDRTGCTYAEAKAALENNEGSVVDAIIEIEEKVNSEYGSVGGESLKDSPIFAKMKEIVDKGNVSRILISKGDRTIVNFPLTAGVIGAVLVPWGAILGIIAALGTQCDIGFVNDKGEVIDINGKVVGAYDKAKDIVTKTVGAAQSTLDKNDVDVSEVMDEVISTIGKAAKVAGDTITTFADSVSEAYKERTAEDKAEKAEDKTEVEVEIKNEEDL